MVIFIAGATHTGKTLHAQKLLEKYHYPYLSIDHLKMGLIRSGYTQLTPVSEKRELDAYLWPVVREIAKTAIENRQNLIIEGCYIPYSYKEDFEEGYLPQIKALWLIFSKQYLERHFENVLNFESAVECRVPDSDALKAMMMEDCERDLEACRAYGLPYRLIGETYEITIDI